LERDFEARKSFLRTSSQTIQKTLKDE
jgi:hypothetical protein